MPDFADQLAAEIAGSPWPIPREIEHRQKVSRRRALSKGDKEQLRQMAGFDDPSRGYIVDPLPDLVRRTFADFLFGETPRYLLESDQERLDDVISETRFTPGIRRAARMGVGEGETWWSLHVNPAIAETPLVTWRSRLDAVPLFYGERLLAVAFVSVVREEMKADADENIHQTVWRHAEIHSEGRVLNRLYVGGAEEIGDERPLESIPETDGLAEDWETGLPMLAGRVVCDIDEDPALGESPLDRIEDFSLALNEALTIATENARLTGKDRVYAAGHILLPDGGLDTGIDVIRVESDGAELGGGDGKPPILAVEKHYDAAPLWLHIAKLTATTLTRAGIVQQLIGEEVEGASAESGVARKMRFLPTENAAEGMGVEWDTELPKILALIFALGALPPSNGETPGGFGWTPIADVPSVERAEPLPADETEIVTRNALAVSSGIRSRGTAIAEQHPEWSQEQIDEEIAAIDADESIAPAPGLDPEH